ncbi:hypothetical protein [Paenibacillus donghaensis]|uniref:hypothetical protein n=1 Tax=Paenibacillus donghaensis TaxID=414771 RepID=UPI001D15ECE5|nr:hypothetical protein [Paenibacillus donghaensis]
MDYLIRDMPFPEAVLGIAGQALVNRPYMDVKHDIVHSFSNEFKLPSEAIALSASSLIGASEGLIEVLLISVCNLDACMKAVLTIMLFLLVLI